MTGRALASAILLLSVSGAATAMADDITTCPATVSPGATGVVQADLDCTSTTDTGYVLLGRGATLDLNGHTLTYHPGAPALSLVRCESNCSITGPGTLTTTAPDYAMIAAASGSVVKVSDATIEGMYVGILANSGRVIVTNTSISAVQWGIAAVKKAKVENLTVAVTQPGGYCIGATEEMNSVVVGSNVTLTSCVDGIWASKKVRLTGLTSTNHSGIGIYSHGRIVLKSSTVTGSPGYDLVSGHAPVLIATTCGHSGVAVDDLITDTWGVCAND
jgi:hypothetical protein